jgi:hypothetical protein
MGQSEQAPHDARSVVFIQCGLTLVAADNCPDAALNSWSRFGLMRRRFKFAALNQK